MRSVGTPVTWSSARESRNWSQPPAWRRRVPTTVPATVSSMAAVSTGWGLTSTNTSWPAAPRARTAVSSSTVRRRLLYQYSASRAVVSSSPPVTVE